MDSYIESCQSDFWQEVFDKEFIYLVHELKGYQKILSVECGPAIVEDKLIMNGFDVTGLDVSQEALQGAPDKMRKIVGFAEAMRFPDSYFDAVIYVASLQFIDNYRKAMEETKRVVKAKGKVVAMLLNPESHFFKERMKNPDSYVTKIKHPDLDVIEKTMSTCLQIEKKEYYLGIRKKALFDSKDPKSACLYIIRGRKL